MHLLNNIRTVSKKPPRNNTVLLRVDFNVSIEKGAILDDQRMTKVIPTILLLLEHNNKIVIISHYERPEKRDPAFSLGPIATHLQKLLPEQAIILIEDFQSPIGKQRIQEQKENEILLLENIRFYKGEQDNDRVFAKELATLGNAYVNDAFGVCHRQDASITLLPTLLPAYAGLLLEKEITSIASFLENPAHPVISIIGGAKISTKIAFLSKLAELSETILLGGGLANTFLLARGISIGKSLVEKDKIDEAKTLIKKIEEKQAKLVLPVDVACLDNGRKVVYDIVDIPEEASILDLGPKTQALFSSHILAAKTLLWNGPLGYCEDDRFCDTTQHIYDAIVENPALFSLIGGGDTLAAVAKRTGLNSHAHLSTGGGAMLELVTNGTLPGIEALRTQ